MLEIRDEDEWLAIDFICDHEPLLGELHQALEHVLVVGPAERPTAPTYDGHTSVKTPEIVGDERQADEKDLGRFAGEAQPFAVQQPFTQDSVGQCRSSLIARRALWEGNW